MDTVRVERYQGAAFLVDGEGRRIFLRGVNVNGLIEYPPDFAESVPLAESDFAEMAALGFNWVRLPVSWSRIMPNPGAPDVEYRQRILKAVNWAWDRRIYTLVDFHQDNYNRHLAPSRECDGAPDWAVRTDRHWIWRMVGNPAVQAAWSNFWHNRTVAGKGLQAHYCEAIAFVAQGMASHPGVLGYDLMNEPDPGWTVPGYFEQAYLFPFYRRCVEAIRETGDGHPIFFEPSVIRDATNLALQWSHPFCTDSQLVYAPHTYTDVASPPFHPLPGRVEPCLWSCYLTAKWESDGFQSPLVMGEFGVSPGVAGDDWIRDQLRMQERFNTGGAFWVWKQRPGFYHWAVVGEDGRLLTDTRRAQILARPRALALPGIRQTVHYDEGSRRLTVTGVLRERANAPALLYASGFDSSQKPVVRVWHNARRVRTDPAIRWIRDPEHTEVYGWRVAVDLTAPGAYRLELQATQALSRSESSASRVEGTA